MEGSGSRSKGWDAAVTFLVLAGLLSIYSRTVADPDLWGHVLYGMAHLEDGSLARTDPYSYMTGAHEWINHEILSELVFGFLFSTFGAVSLIIFKTALSLLIVGLLYRHLYREGLDTLRAGLVVLVASFALAGGLVTVRPQMFTHLFFTFLLLVLVSAERHGARRLWWVPVILAVWINFHGGVLAGLGVLVIWSVAHLGVRVVDGRWGVRSESPVSPWVAVGVTIVAAAALLVNPYGWGLPEFLFRTATGARPEILDWQPLEIGSLRGAVYLLMVAAAALALARSRRPKNLPLLAVLLVTAILPLLALRHLQLFAIAFVLLLGEQVADAWIGRREPRSGTVRASDTRVRSAFIGVAVLAGLMITLTSVPNFGCLRLDPRVAMAFPARATTVLVDSGVSGRLVVPFSWGQYAIWHLYPAMQVSMDGRRETVYPDHVYARHLNFHYGVGEWDAHLDDPPADVALLQTNSAPYNLVSLRPDWTLVHRDETASVFVREGSEAVPVLGALTDVERDLAAIPSDGAGLCFP